MAHLTDTDVANLIASNHMLRSTIAVAELTFSKLAIEEGFKGDTKAMERFKELEGMMSFGRQWKARPSDLN